MYLFTRTTNSGCVWKVWKYRANVFLNSITFLNIVDMIYFNLQASFQFRLKTMDPGTSR